MRLRPAAVAAIAGAMVAGTLLPGRAQQPAPSASTPQTPPASVIDTLRWRSIGPDRGGRSIAVSGVQGPAEGGVLRRRRRRTVEDDRRRRELGAGDRRPDRAAPRSAPSPCRSRTPTSSTSGWARRASAATSCPATASTSPPTPARPGRTSASASRTRSRRSASTRPTPTSSSSRRSASTARRARSAACSRAPTAARPGRRCCSATTKTGAVDISIDRRNPNVIYAALWEAYRNEYQMSSGGPGSGLFKTTDGGETWTEITRNPGLPSGVVGRIGVAVSGAEPEPRLRARREREGRAVPLRRRRRDVDAGERQPQHPAARVLLHARHRRSRRRRTSSTC